MRNLASKVRHQRPPSSKQTSNQQSDRLDFGNGVGGEKTTNGNLQNAAGKSTAGEKSGLLIDTDSELEEGEIQSEVDTNDEDSKQAVKRRGKINVEKTKSDSHKLKSCSDFALSASSHQLAQNGPKKSKNKREVESKVNVGSDESEISKCGQSSYSSGEQSSETDKFKSSSDLMSSENRTSDIDSVEESDEGEIYSGSDENVAYSYKDNMDDLDIEDLCVLGQTTTESELDDTLVENKSMGSPQKRKRSTGEETMVITINNENCLVNEGQCPQYKKPRIENDIGDGNDKLNVEKDSGKYRGVKSGDVRSSTYSEKTGLEIHIGEEHDSPGTQELEIIDDLGGDEDLDGDADSIGDCRDYNGDFESDEDLDDNEIYAWLEEGIGKRASTEEDGGHMQREKVVLKERGHDPFELLPEGWVLVTHNSGMPVYLHKQSRVCTLSKPYFLGPGSVRKHDIPVSAIPCLHYQKEKEREQSQNQEKGEITQENGTQENRVDSASNKDSAEINKDDGEKSADVCSKPEGATMDVTSEPEKADDQNNDSSLTVPPVKIEYAKERIKQNSLSVSEVRKYCERLFEFKTITVKKFKTWKDRRRHLNTIKRQSRPALPSNTKLITCTVPQEKGGDKPKRKEFVLNPTGKSYVCILHEYAQHTLRVQPRYVFRELENAQNPYSATVVINDVDYGRGYASSKKNAKMEAAKATLSILIPEMTKVIEEQAQDFEDLSFFDEIKIEDPRVYELCNKVGQPGPYQILLECLKRNYGMGDTHCKIDVKTLKHQKSEYTLTVGKHSVTVVCKNKREGKQRAAQAMLQQLHPHIFTLGALLRLYGRSSWKSVKEKKKEEHSITELQSHARSKRPNTALLEKLKEEMIKLKTQKDAIKSRGKFRVDSHSLPGNVIGLDL